MPQLNRRDHTKIKELAFAYHKRVPECITTREETPTTIRNEQSTATLEVPTTHHN